MDIWWLLQAAGSLILFLVFVHLTVRAVKAEASSKIPTWANHASVVAAGLAIISLANAATSYATAVSPPLDELRNIGGGIVRGVLLILAIYILALGPWYRRHWSRRGRKG